MLLQLLIFSIITASISFTISESKLFANFRDDMYDRSRRLGELFSCGYCLGFWVSFFLIALYPFKIINGFFYFDYFLTALAIAWLSAFQWIIMCWIMDQLNK